MGFECCKAENKLHPLGLQLPALVHTLVVQVDQMRLWLQRDVVICGVY